MNYLKSKRDLIYPIYEFNMLPANYVDRSWLAPLIPDILISPLVNSKRGLIQLSNLILEYYNLKQAFFFEFNEPICRYALLPSDVLCKLTFYCAIAINHSAIRSVIDKHRKKQLIDCIGEQGYNFAIERASLLTGNFNNSLELEIMWDNLYEYFYTCGAKFFLSCYSDMSKPLFKRLLLKFNKHLYENNDLLNIKFSHTLKTSIIKRIMKHNFDKHWQKIVF